MSHLFAWDRITREFKEENGESLADLLFHDSNIVSTENNIFLIKVDALAFTILDNKESHNYKQISKILKKLYGNDIDIVFTLDNVIPDYINIKSTDIVDEVKKVSLGQYTYKKTNLKPTFTFENYYYSYDNRSIIEGCKQVINEVSQNVNDLTFNPYFVFGPSGIGKTHLSMAIGNEIHKLDQTKRVLYKNATEFFNEYTGLFKGSLKTDQLDKFKDLYFNLDVFIIDDIQMLQTKEGSLNEFFSIFENLRLNNKAVIITSDVEPKLLGFEDRLLTRFLSGLVVPMNFPDSDTKTQIFKDHASKINLELEESAIQVFIDSSKNVRELLGYINSIKLDLISNNLSDKIYTKNQAIEVVSKATGSNIKMTKDDIIEIVCNHFDVKRSDLKIKSRKPEILVPRNFCIYYLKTKVLLTYVVIAKEFNMKDHTNAVKIVKDFEKYKVKYQKDYEFLSQKINMIR